MIPDAGVIVTAACAPDARLPLDGETLNQDEVLLRPQFTTPEPVFVKVIVWVAGLNGPPDGPVNETLFVGKIASASFTVSVKKR